MSRQVILGVLVIGMGALGGSVVYKAMTGRRLIGTSLKDVAAGDDVVDVTAILGGFERRIGWRSRSRWRPRRASACCRR